MVREWWYLPNSTPQALPVPREEGSPPPILSACGHCLRKASGTWFLSSFDRIIELQVSGVVIENIFSYTLSNK
jgi:hypothetical protein